MSDDLANVRARISGAHDLASVIGAMRAAAAARTHEAREQLAGIRACADAVAFAIGDALAMSPTARDIRELSPADSNNGAIAIVLCTEQGFVGAYNHQVIRAATAQVSGERVKYFIAGEKGLRIASERCLSVDWRTNMISHVAEAAAIANEITGALYECLSKENIDRASVWHGDSRPGGTIQIVERRLLPFDFSHFVVAPRPNPPLITLPLPVLLENLAQEYVFTQLSEAIMLSFAAENEARMRAMLVAHKNVQVTIDTLNADFRRLRQEEITMEINELVAGGIASR